MNGRNLKAGPDSGTGHKPPRWSRPGRLESLAWLPIPLLAAAIVIGRVADLSESYTSEHLTLVLSSTFYSMVPLGTLFLIGRGFMALGAGTAASGVRRDPVPPGKAANKDLMKIEDSSLIVSVADDYSRRREFL